MLLEVAGLHFRYLDASELALTDINLSVREGEFVAVVGAAGAGKTTLASCLNGIIPHFQDGAWAGTVRLAGSATVERSPASFAQLVGTVGADPERQMVAMTVEEEVAFGLENLCLPREEIEDRLIDALAMAGALHLRSRAVNTLSGGEKGRLALASVLALRPRVLILDEPVAELDPVGAEQVLAAIARLHCERGTTVIHLDSRLSNVISHADRLIILHRGRIMADGPLRRLAADGGLLRGAGLAPPPVTRAALLCRDRGMLPRTELPLSLDELKAALAGGRGR